MSKKKAGGKKNQKDEDWDAFLNETLQQVAEKEEPAPPQPPAPENVREMIEHDNSFRLWFLRLDGFRRTMRKVETRETELELATERRRSVAQRRARRQMKVLPLLPTPLLAKKSRRCCRRLPRQRWSDSDRCKRRKNAFGSCEKRRKPAFAN
jgi:hypothetical protein